METHVMMGLGNKLAQNRRRSNPPATIAADTARRDGAWRCQLAQRGLPACSPVMAKPQSVSATDSTRKPRRPAALAGGDFSCRAANGVGDDEDHHGADDRDKDAVEIEPGDTQAAKSGHEPAADNRTDDAKHDVQQHALAVPVDELARDKAGDEAEKDPRDDRHK